MSNANNLIDFAAQLLRFAEADLRLARREGSILIGGTTAGNVWLSYDRPSKTYTLTNTSGDVLADGPRRIVATELAKSYKVVEG